MNPPATGLDDSKAAFIDAGVWHGSLEGAQAILAANPEIAGSDIFVGALLGDEAAVRACLARDPSSATAKGGPRGWEPLLYLCLSKYLRLDPERSAGFVRAAEALLDAGADPNSGFWTTGEHPEFESALYGAAGVAHNAELTRLLLARGAVPDGEVVYHAAESYDNDAMKLLVASGTLSDEHRTILLIRKHDWHDAEGVRWLLENGADPNRRSPWGFVAIQHAISRDNALGIIELLLDHGADPTIAQAGQSAAAMAALYGRGDVLELFERRGIPVELHGVEGLLAACARGDVAGVQAIAQSEPQLVRDVVAQGGKLLAQFAGNGNTQGVARLLDLGVDVDALFEEGNGYWDIARDSTALHVAAWRARHESLRLLIARGASVLARDGKGRTPLVLAVRACVDSYWMARRTPESVDALLRAGASVADIATPTGYAEVDALLRQYGGAA